LPTGLAAFYAAADMPRSKLLDMTDLTYIRVSCANNRGPKVWEGKGDRSSRFHCRFRFEIAVNPTSRRRRATCFAADQKSKSLTAAHAAR